MLIGAYPDIAFRTQVAKEADDVLVGCCDDEDGQQNGVYAVLQYWKAWGSCHTIQCWWYVISNEC